MDYGFKVTVVFDIEKTKSCTEVLEASYSGFITKVEISKAIEENPTGDRNFLAIATRLVFFKLEGIAGKLGSNYYSISSLQINEGDIE